MGASICFAARVFLSLSLLKPPSLALTVRGEALFPPGNTQPLCAGRDRQTTTVYPDRLPPAWRSHGATMCGNLTCLQECKFFSNPDK